MYEHTKSFIVYSREHRDFANKLYVEDMVQGVVEEKVVEWGKSPEYLKNNSIPPGWTNVLVEVFPVETTTLPLQPRADSPYGHPNRQAVVLEDLVI
jgi:hypothetical protein